MPNLYRTSPLTAFPPGTTTSAGYTQRMMFPISAGSYSGQRVLSTYLSTVMVLSVAGVYMSDGGDADPRSDLKGISPFQVYRIYTTTLSSPDGDLPYKHGDYFVPNQNMVGLVAGTAHPIRGFMPYPTHVELIVERKL